MKRSYDEPTHSAPVKNMSDPVFSLIGFWRHSLIDVLCFGIMGVVTATKIDMDMSSHRLANHIAQHRTIAVIRGKFATV